MEARICSPPAVGFELVQDRAHRFKMGSVVGRILQRSVAGDAAVIASANPVSPSTAAIRKSAMPRVRRSFITLNRNLAPSVYSIQSPNTSFSPEQAMAGARSAALF